ncbi:oxidoreductase [Falsihalocynthiibacter sp. SS001]|uniref:oxidoreductase n=1 Tax=Falsihalocynthiibacter sp. SS001 TaxID=3349698 RepID=UPI0036D2CF8E
MKVCLADKVIIVTGAASGIGAAIARLAAESGVGGLVLTDRDAAGLGAVAAGIKAPVVQVVANLLDPSAPKQIIEAAIDGFGRIDGLVNAAGITSRASVLDGDIELWDALFAVNTRAAFFLMQCAIRDMTARRASGAIVNILSINAHCGTEELAIYSASKGALLTLTKNAANAHLADRIRVNGINLGWADTPVEHQMQADILGQGDAWREEASARLPLGRLITPEEAARTAVFLLADASVPMTGVAVDLEQRVIGVPK